jgi:lipoate-protein ligase A
VSVVLSAKPDRNPVFKIRHIPYKACPGQFNMALDHLLASSFNRHDSGIIRFYAWQPFCLSLGFHQASDVQLKQRLAAAGYDMVRRPTGGRAILHAEELTYSAIFATDFMPPRKLYEFLHGIIAAGLQSLDFYVSPEQLHTQIPTPRSVAEDFLCFTHSAYSEIQYQGKKVVGSAQRIYPDCILQHGSILLGNTHARLADFICGSPQQQEHITAEIKAKTITLGQIKPDHISIEKIIKSIIKQLELSLTISINFEDITETERAKVRDFIIPL